MESAILSDRSKKMVGKLRCSF